MSANPQRTNTPKNVAVYFKDVNTEETLSSQDQKLVELPICDDNFFQTKITTAQIRFCNDRQISRIDDWNNNELMKTS